MQIPSIVGDKLKMGEDVLGDITLKEQSRIYTREQTFQLYRLKQNEKHSNFLLGGPKRFLGVRNSYF